MKRNECTKDEMILALDLYYKLLMQLFRKFRQTLEFNKFKTCLKNSDIRKV